jgi:tripartite-type tricarboxylate transporter receptor subunit TctC
LFALPLLAAACAYAQAEPFPSKPVRILVGSAPGGGLDTTARAISDRLSAALGQPVVIDNRPGAAGTVAGQILTKAAPDGYTINLGAIGNFAVNYSLYKNIGYHPLKDIAPITMMVDATNIVVVHPGVAANTFKELLALAAKQPGMTYGSSGSGNAGHLAGELLSRMAKVQLTHVPYKGGGPAMLDLIGGRINMIFASPSSAIPQWKAGKIRALAVTTRKRSQIAPELPTIAESGVPGYEVNNWYAMGAPAKTPRPVIARLNKELVAILNVPEVRQLLLQQGLEAAPSTPEELGRYMKSEFEKWGKLIAEAKISAE